MAVSPHFRKTRSAYTHLGEREGAADGVRVKGNALVILALLGSLCTLLLELGLLFGLDVGNGEDQANATEPLSSQLGPLNRMPENDALFVAKLAGEGDLIQSRAVHDLHKRAEKVSRVTRLLSHMSTKILQDSPPMCPAP